MDFKFILIHPSLLFALLSILIICGFQEKLFDMFIPRCVATGTALRVSSCILYEISMGSFDLVMSYFTFRGFEGHLPGLFPVG